MSTGAPIGVPCAMSSNTIVNLALEESKLKLKKADENRKAVMSEVGGSAPSPLLGRQACPSWLPCADGRMSAGGGAAE